MILGTSLGIGLSFNSVVGGGGGGGDVTAPAIVSTANGPAVINAAGTLLTLTYDEAPSSAFEPAAVAYTLTGTSSVVTAVNVNGNTVELTCSPPIRWNEIVKVSYTQPVLNKLRDAAGNFAASFSDQATWNNSTSYVTVAPSVLGSAVAIGTSGTTRTPDVEPLGLITGDKLLMRVFSRISDAGATLTITVPAGQGWFEINKQIEGSYSNALYEKTWGVDGQTDDFTPTVTIAAAGVGGNSAVEITGIRNAGSRSQVTAWTTTASNVTQTSPVVTNPPAATDLTLWLFSTVDDSALASPSRGTLGYGGAGYNVSTTGSIGMAYEAGVNSSVNTCSMTETTNGPDAGRTLTIVYSARTTAPEYALSLFSVDTNARSLINGGGWRSALHTHFEPIGGVLHRYMAMVGSNPIRSLIFGVSTSTDGGATWSAWTKYTTASIPDPPGIANWQQDSHFAPTVGTTDDGKPQIFFMAHGSESPMLYWRGTTPTDVTCSSFTEWVPPNAWLINPASYPRLGQLSDGTAIMVCRDGTAGGNSTYHLYEQSAADPDVWLECFPTGMWDWVTGGDEHSQYVDQMIVDSNDDVHFSFLYARNNETDDFLNRYYCKAHRVSPGVWTLADIDGTAKTAPVDETHLVTRTTGYDAGQNAHCGIGLNVDGTPLLPHFLGDGADTRLWLTMRVAGATVHRDLGLIATAWNLVGAPPKSEYALCRTPEAFYWKGAIVVVWSSNQTVGPGGLPYFVAKRSTDNGVTWSAAYRFINEETGDHLCRYDANALIKHGLLMMPVNLVDVNANFGNPISTPSFVAQLY